MPKVLNLMQVHLSIPTISLLMSYLEVCLFLCQNHEYVSTLSFTLEMSCVTLRSLSHPELTLYMSHVDFVNKRQESGFALQHDENLSFQVVMCALAYGSSILVSVSLSYMSALFSVL